MVVVRLVPLLAVAVAMGGCGGGERLVDTHALRAEITRQLSKSFPGAVKTCPDKVQIHSGDVFDCSVTGTGGVVRVVSVKILDPSGDTRWWPAVNQA